MPGLRAKRLKGLRIEEASGVDAPAHLAPGWMVMKSAGTGEPDPLDDLTDEQIEALIKAAEADEQGEPVSKELIETLTKALGSLPDAAKAQATALIGALGGDAGAGDDPVAKAVSEALTKAQTERDTAVAKATELEAELAKAKGPAAAETEEEALAKAMATLPEPVRKAWEADRARIAKAEAAAAEGLEKAEHERDARVSAEYLTKAKGPDYEYLPTKAETLGTVLREVDEKLSDVAKAEVHRLLKAGSHFASGANADAFKEFGGAGEDVTAQGPDAQLLAKAKELRTADPSLSEAQAITKAADFIGHNVKEG